MAPRSPKAAYVRYMARTLKAAAQWGPKLHIAFGQGNTWQVGAA